MKLCKKCIPAVYQSVGREEYNSIDDMVLHAHIEGVPESECEFWAHKELNGCLQQVNLLELQKKILPRFIIDFDEKQPSAFKLLLLWPHPKGDTEQFIEAEYTYLETRKPTGKLEREVGQ